MSQNLFKEYEGVFEEKIAPPKEKKERVYDYSPFALQDALGERSAKKAWIEYNKLILEGVEPEDLIHKIVSKVRDMAAIQKGATATDLGIKDYPFSKSKGHLKNWPASTLEEFYTKLVTLYHQSRMGGESLGVAIEQTLLGL